MCLLIVLGAHSCASPQPVENRAIPLNLDFALPGIVSPSVPWGWSFSSADWAGVEVSTSADSGRLTLNRAEAGSDAQLVYDLADPFAERLIEFRGSVHTGGGTDALLRIGVWILDEGWELAEAFSDWTAGGTLSAQLTAPSDSYNVQLVIEYRGSGTVHIDNLAFSLDGINAGSTLPEQPVTDPEIVEWVRQRAIPLETTHLQDPTDDLDALAPLIGDRKLLLLGESTHGSAEFFTWKARFVRWLAQQGRPVVFVLEDHPHQAEKIDRFIRTGEGDAATAVEGLFGFWRRQEVVDLVQWMRDATAAQEIRLTFAGVDLQVPLGPIDRIDAVARELDPGLADGIEELLRPMQGAWEAQRYPQRAAEEYDRWVESAKRVREMLEEAGASERTLFDARLVRQSAELSAAGGDIRVRDRFLADNFIWLRDRSPADARFVVWAHNTHVRLNEDAMGQFLAEQYPGEVMSMGLFTDRGSYIGFDGRQLRSYELFPSPPGSFEEALRLAGPELFALDLREAREMLSAPIRHRNIGLWPADLGFYATVIPDGFDAALYVGQTTPTRPIGPQQP